MKFTTKFKTIKRIIVTVPVKKLLNKKQTEHFLDKYYLEDKEFNQLKLEVIADTLEEDNEKNIELWYGLQDYGSRYFAFASLEKSSGDMTVDEFIAITFNEYVDWDVLFKSMYTDPDNYEEINP